MDEPILRDNQSPALFAECINNANTSPKPDWGRKIRPQIHIKRGRGEQREKVNKVSEETKPKTQQSDCNPLSLQIHLCKYISFLFIFNQITSIRVHVCVCFLL
jgi:hypothetical protein